MRLSEDLRKWRSNRPDEWTMDRFIQEATRLEAEVEKFTSTNTGSPKLLDILENMLRSGLICDRNYHKQALDIIEQLRAGA